MFDSVKKPAGARVGDSALATRGARHLKNCQKINFQNTKTLIIAKRLISKTQDTTINAKGLNCTKYKTTTIADNMSRFYVPCIPVQSLIPHGGQSSFLGSCHLDGLLFPAALSLNLQRSFASCQLLLLMSCKT